MILNSSLYSRTRSIVARRLSPVTRTLRSLESLARFRHVVEVAWMDGLVSKDTYKHEMPDDSSSENPISSNVAPAS